MTCKGDMVATLISMGLLEHRLDPKAIVTKILDCADDPNFAQRFAHWKQEGKADEDTGHDMLAYWDVIRFLKEMI